MKLKLIFSLILVCGGYLSCSVQKYNLEEYSQYKIYRNLNKALRNKDDVIILVISDMNLKEFPIEITKLTNLKVLNLTNNAIEYIPQEINKLKSLERMDLMYNKLRGLPSTITELKNLKRINIAYNGLYAEDVEFVKKALPDCFIITEIIL